jgi:hypothetical protein
MVFKTQNVERKALFEARKLDIVVLLVFGGMTIEYRTS